MTKTVAEIIRELKTQAERCAEHAVAGESYPADGTLLYDAAIKLEALCQVSDNLVPLSDMENNPYLIPCWLQIKHGNNPDYLFPAVLDTDRGLYWNKWNGSKWKGKRSEYGKTWRCWYKRPDKDERSIPWAES